MAEGFPYQSYEQAGLGTRTAAQALPAERLTFIRKVYSLFFVSVLFAVAGGYAALQTGFTLWLVQHPIIAIAAYLGGVFLVQGMSRAPGINVVLLFVYAAFTGAYFSIAVLAAALQTGSFDVAVQAFGLTLVVFGGLTLFAFVSRTDFSFLRGFLFTGLLILLGIGVLSLFFGFLDQGMFTVYAVGVVLIMAGYVLYDTSNILRHYGTNQAVAAALAIYIDFAILFVYLLRLLADRR